MPPVSLAYLDHAPSWSLDAPPSTSEFTLIIVGRMEDPTLKGLDIAAASVGILARRLHEQRKQIELIVRGVPEGLGESTRDYVTAIARRTTKSAVLLDDASAASLTNLKVVTRPYTSDGSRIAKDLRSATALLMPSRVEGYGLVAQESLMVGVPPLVSNHSGIAQHMIMLLNPTRLIVETDEDIARAAPDWADAIEHLLNNPDEVRREALQIRDMMARAKYGEQAVKSLVTALAPPAAAGKPARPVSPVAQAVAFTGQYFAVTKEGTLSDKARSVPEYLARITKAFLSGSRGSPLTLNRYSMGWHAHLNAISPHLPPDK